MSPIAMVLATCCDSIVGVKVAVEFGATTETQRATQKLSTVLSCPSRHYIGDCDGTVELAYWQTNEGQVRELLMAGMRAAGDTRAMHDAGTMPVFFDLRSALV